MVDETEGDLGRGYAGSSRGEGQGGGLRAGTFYAFHESIRRLHISGVSLREIARRLEISHQRVHQIVSDTACGFCGRRRADVKRLIAGPGALRLSAACVSLGLHALAQGWGARDRNVVFDVTSEPELTCCFCRKPGRKAGPLVVGGNLRICGHCLTLAAKTLDEYEHPRPARHRRRRAKMLSPGTLEPTARVGQVLEQAALEAQDLQQPSLLPEHLLLGILGVPDSVGAKASPALGVDAESVRRELFTHHAPGTEPVYPPLGLVAETKRVMELARIGGPEAQAQLRQAPSI